jgi:type I restriction enzyme M protein
LHLLSETASEKILGVLIDEVGAIEFGEEMTLAYETLIFNMVNTSISSGAFHSPQALVSAIVKVTDLFPGDSVYDPALGTGRFIVEANKLISHSVGRMRCNSLSSYGQDLSPFACLVGTLNLLLHGINVKNVYLGDSLLRSDKALYDVVLSGVPFGKPNSVEKYVHGYEGVSENLEAMFLRHVMRKLSNAGRAAVIIPNGIFFNKTRELIGLRRELLTDFNLHTVLSLPAGVLSPYTAVKVSVVFFDRAEKTDDVWFYELKPDKPLSKTNPVCGSDFLEFVEFYSQRTETPSSFLIDKSVLLSSETVDISAGSISASDEQSDFSVDDELSRLLGARKESDALYSQLTGLLGESDQIGFVEKVTIGDLFKIKSGRPLKKSELIEGASFPVYGGNGIIGCYDKYNLDGENILIGRVGAQCGNIHFVKGPIWLTNNAFCVQLKSPSSVFMPYLAHVLRGLELNSLARGTAQPSISYASIKDLELTLPTYDRQVLLSSWFDEIQWKEEEFRKSIEFQVRKLQELTNHVINSRVK